MGYGEVFQVHVRLVLICGSEDYSKRNLRYGTLSRYIHMLELAITSSYLIVDSEVQLSTPAVTAKSDECFQKYSKMEQPIAKGQVWGRGREGVGVDCLRTDMLWNMGYPSPELTFTPLHS